MTPSSAWTSAGTRRWPFAAASTPSRAELANVEDDPGRWWSTLRDLCGSRCAGTRSAPAGSRCRNGRATLPRSRGFATSASGSSGCTTIVRSMDREYGSLFPWLRLLRQAPPALAAVAAAVATVVPPTLRLDEIAARAVRRASYPGGAGRSRLTGR